MISPLADKTILTTLHHGGANGTVTRLVIHATVSPCVRGGAEANARYFQSPAAGGAAHYVVDPGMTVACLDEDTLGFHAPPNEGSIGIELCDPQTGDPSRWDDPDHQEMLERAARLAADICARHGLPLVWLSPADLLAGNRGLTGHVEVSQAWHRTDHTDPGVGFPVDRFLSLLQPAPQPLPEDDIVKATYVLRDGHADVHVLLATGECKPVSSFADCEEVFHATLGVEFVTYSAVKNITDGKNVTRGVWVLDGATADTVGLP